VAQEFKHLVQGLPVDRVIRATLRHFRKPVRDVGIHDELRRHAGGAQGGIQVLRLLR